MFELILPFFLRIPATWRSQYTSASVLNGSRSGVKRSAAVSQKPMSVDQQKQVDGLFGQCESILSKKLLSQGTRANW